ncbi:MAG: lysylphosphatidylglycerol synthase transmembrane domain-containing protein [Bacteroidales bacterium]
MKKSIRKGLFLLLHMAGFILLWFVVRDLQWNDFLKELASFPAWKYIAGLTILAGVYIMKSWRWQLLNRSFGIQIPLKTAIVFYLSAGFLSVITPGRLGEFAKIYFLKRKYNVNTAMATSSVMLDRIWDVLVLSLFASISMAFFFAGASIIVLLLMAALFIVSMLVIVLPGAIFKPLLFTLQRFSRLKEKVNEIYIMWKSKRFNSITRALVLTLLSFLMLAGIPVLFSSGSPYPIDFMEGIGAISISNILSFIPITIAGFGTRELVFTEIWKLSEYPKEIAISVSTSYFMVTYLGSLLIGGLVYLLRLKELYRPGEIRQMRGE